MFSGLLQTPSTDRRAPRFYGTAGWRALYCRDAERQSGDRTVGVNVGGGVKISLIGPIRLRLDYRVMTLQGGRAAPEAAAVLRRSELQVLRGRVRTAVMKSGADRFCETCRPSATCCVRFPAELTCRRASGSGGSRWQTRRRNSSAFPILRRSCLSRGSPERMTRGSMLGGRDCGIDHLQI